MLKEKKLALALAKKAAAFQLKNFGKAVFRAKGVKDLVGEVDEKINALCTREIRKLFPHDEIIAEESSSAGGNGHLWVIDPLDATVNYANRIPFFAFALAFLENREPKFSLVNAPLLKEFYYAEKEKGAFLNGKRLKCDQKLSPEKTLVGIPSLHNHLDYVPLFAKIAGNFIGTRNIGCSSLEFAGIASGRLGARVKPRAKLWDALPPCFIVEQAGGIATDFNGKRYSLYSKDVIASANVKIHERLLELVR